MSKELNIRHINQVVEISYMDLTWNKSYTMVGTLAGFRAVDGFHEWWMVGNDTRYEFGDITVRTVSEIENAWMQK